MQARRQKLEFRFTDGTGKRREIGLGSAASVSLARARQKAASLRESIADGDDPMAARTIKTVRLADIADRFIEKHAAAWTDATTADWRQQLKARADTLLAMPVDRIRKEHVLAVLQPIWQPEPTAAKRLAKRLERIFNFAIAIDARSDGVNPATLKGVLEHLLPAQGHTTTHRNAVLVNRAPELFNLMWQQRHERISAPAVCFVALTACRPAEAARLRWDYIDRRQGTITWPAKDMKARREHAIQLTPKVAELIDGVQRHNHGLVFLNADRAGKIFVQSMLRYMRDASGEPYDLHGWRSCFSDWCASQNLPREHVEDQLAHVVGSATERAYRRGSYIEQRRELMLSWERYLCGLPSGA